jgi:hypothetical protein
MCILGEVDIARALAEQAPIVLRRGSADCDGFWVAAATGRILWRMPLPAKITPFRRNLR